MTATQTLRPTARVARAVRPLLPGHAAATVFGRNLRVMRYAWIILFSGVVEPVLYLLTVDTGLDPLIGQIDTVAGPVSYAAFVAPALLAAAAMNAAIAESTFNFYFKLRVERIFDAVLSTPAQPRDVIWGEQMWTTFRGGGYALMFLLAAWPFGVLQSWWAVAALPAAMLVTLAFGSVGALLTTFMRSWQDFDYITLVSAPLFLFSATFYPLDVYPPAVRFLAQLSPLYHATELMRACMLGAFDRTLLLHGVVLGALAGIGLYWGPRRLEKLLRT